VLRELENIFGIDTRKNNFDKIPKNLARNKFKNNFVESLK